MTFNFSFNPSPDSSPATSRPASPVPAIERPPTPVLPPSIAPKLHTLKSLLETLEVSSYERVPSLNNLPRRPLSDTKVQAFRSTPLPATGGAVDVGLSSPSDLQNGVYEGGFKTWEGGIDLAAYLDLQSSAVIDQYENIVELGTGVGLPSCALLRRWLKEPVAEEGQQKKRRRLIIQDFNIEVLELVTISNLFLTWMDVKGLLKAEDENALGGGYVELEESQQAEFLADLEAHGVEVYAVSGGWGVDMVKILEDVSSEGTKFGDKSWLVLAAETIYQVPTLPAFLEMLLAGVKAGGLGWIAAKEFYFGVGGNVGEFVKKVQKKGVEANEIWRTGEGGVGRVIVEVKN
ncbi:hypothetical protein BJ508DRAFT_372148 [Ascobolus immersus RN42]|uniref:protein-histidine N-methyltransferase n=1 Tax=Ascobolus immersus RN42 TaxID=1160509 RepID=A0A3N4IS27_ASCIM|nr:hypothetical protein BJ508DRAFT_372148 [Ascobolus immersus RN42]